MYTLVGPDGRLDLLCSYIAIGPQFGEVSAEVVAAPYSRHQSALTDGYSKPSAYKLEGVEYRKNLPSDMIALANFARTATALERPNDSTLTILPGPANEVIWTYDQSLQTGKATLVLIPAERLDPSSSSGAPALPVLLTAIKGDKGDPGDQGNPGLGLPTPPFPSAEGKVPVARGNEATGYRLESIGALLVAGTGITLTQLPNGQFRISTTGSTPPPNPGSTPSVTLTSSNSNVTASGSITLTAVPANITGVARVEFYRGSTLLSVDLSSPFTASVLLANADNGTVAFIAKAFDSSSVETSSNTVSVVVNIAGGGDTTPPTVTLSSNSTNVTTNAFTLTLTADSADNIQVNAVRFYRDGALKTQFAPMAPSSTDDFLQELTSADNGTYNYHVIAIDSSGNYTESNHITVVVNIP